MIPFELFNLAWLFAVALRRRRAGLPESAFWVVVTSEALASSLRKVSKRSVRLDVGRHIAFLLSRPY